VSRVLVVEDNADLRDMYQEILTMSGHEAQLAETAAEALTALANARPDVVLLDLGIAGGITEILAALGSGSHVILASGARDLPERAAAVGAAAYLLKPFGPEQLLAVVDKVAAAP
jgi:two-component system KDP operon response regulator KdpE